MANKKKNIVLTEIKNKAMKESKKFLADNPYVLLALVIVAVIFILSCSITSMMSGQYKDPLNGADDPTLNSYLSTKISETNNANTYYDSTVPGLANISIGKMSDFYEFDKDIALTSDQVTAYSKYIELTDTNVVLDNILSKADRYKQTIDNACNQLKPKFNYILSTIETKKKYKERVFSFSELGTGVYSAYKSKMNVDYKIVTSLPNISSCKNGDKYYVLGDGVYTVSKTPTKLVYYTLGSGLINSKGNIIKPSYKIVTSLPNIYSCNTGEEYYVIGDGLYKVLKTANYYCPHEFELVSTDIPSELKNMQIYYSDYALPNPPQSQIEGSLVYVIKEDRTYSVIPSYYYPSDTSLMFTETETGSPSELNDIKIIKDYTLMPNAKETSDGSVFYCINQDKSYTTTSKLEDRESNSAQAIFLLKSAITIENTWTMTYESKTDTQKTTEAGIEGTVTYEVTRPIIKARTKTYDVAYTKLKAIVLAANPKEDVDSIVSMVKFSGDKTGQWFFKTAAELDLMDPVSGNSGSDGITTIPAEYIDIYNSVSKEFGIPTWLLEGITRKESTFNQNAQGDGSFGLMQLQKTDTVGNDLWDYQYRTGLGAELKANGYVCNSSVEAWELYKSSSKVQIISGAYMVQYYINYVFWKQGKISKFDSTNKDTATKINWNSDNIDDYQDVVKRILACYNMGEGSGMTVNLATNDYSRVVFAYAMEYKNTSGLVTFAKKFLGTPYVWGGATPDGFDCSGFVQYVYAHFGFMLPRTTYDQIKAGTAVSIDNLQIGDLVFFDTGTSSIPTDPEHVGMYIGDGEFIESPKTGDVIKIVPIAGYYTLRFVGARRYF